MPSLPGVAVICVSLPVTGSTENALGMHIALHPPTFTKLPLLSVGTEYRDEFPAAELHAAGAPALASWKAGLVESLKAFRSIVQSTCAGFLNKSFFLFTLLMK